jgi:hypothetical protein
MILVKLTSGKELDAHGLELSQHTVELLDRNGDVMHRVGQPLVDSIEQVAV